MLVRNTFSLESEYINSLKDILKKNNLKSLSSLMNKIIKQFLAEYEKKRKLEELEKNYKAYFNSFNKKSFQEIEELALTDIK